MSETVLILRINDRDMIKMRIVLHVKCPLFLSVWNEILIFSTNVRKILKYRISLQSVQWEQSCSMRTDGLSDRRTDTTKLIVVFRNFTKTPKNKFQNSSASCTYFVQNFVLLKIPTLLNCFYALFIGTSTVH